MIKSNNDSPSILVSIIVAVYNAEQDLYRCLDSLINQTYKNIEVICVDDASTDNSLKILNEYAAKSSIITVISHDSNKHAGGSYNTGIKAAKGEYICIVDNDDWLDKDAINKLVQASEGGYYDIVGPACCQVYGNEIMSISPAFLISNNKDEIIQHALKNGFSIIGDLIRRDIHIKNKLYYPEDVFYEDIAIGYSILFLAHSIKGIEEPLYYYTHNTTSVTGNTTIRKVLDRINSIDLYKDNLIKRGFYDVTNKELIDYKYLLYSAYSIVMLSKTEYRDAKKHVNRIILNIKRCLPNSIINQASLRNKFIIYFPRLAFDLLFIVARIYHGKRK